MARHPKPWLELGGKRRPPTFLSSSCSPAMPASVDSGRRGALGRPGFGDAPDAAAWRRARGRLLSCSTSTPSWLLTCCRRTSRSSSRNSCAQRRGSHSEFSFAGCRPDCRYRNLDLGVLRMTGDSNGGQTSASGGLLLLWNGCSPHLGLDEGKRQMKRSGISPCTP